MRPVILTILDGWGYSKSHIGNAIYDAGTPTMKSLIQNFPSTLLQASGKAVGMTWGEPGNSEVGHLTLGAGRIIFQALSRINKSIETEEYFKNPTLLAGLNHVKNHNSKFHIVGLLTSGSVHSYMTHLVATLEFFSRNGFNNVKVHLFADGKDSGTKESESLLQDLNYYLDQFKVGNIATVIGRDFGMDRNKNWELTKATYDLLVSGIGQRMTVDPISALHEYHAQGIIDPKIPGLIFDDNGKIEDKDAVFFLNFREDSMRQIARCFIETEEEFSFFPRKFLSDIFISSMVPYLNNPRLIPAFEAFTISNGLGETLGLNSKKQLHIAETEKYAHVTFFFNGLIDKPWLGETDILIQSNKSVLEDPAMKAREITTKVIEELGRDYYDFIVINFANADMLAHTGNLSATTQGVAVVDECLGKLVPEILAKDGILMITADHGNAEQMIYNDGDIKTKHESSPVPFILIAKEYQRERTPEEVEQNASQVGGILSDVAPTILTLMNLRIPAEMSNDNLLRVVK
jgi:2,3-bisphosphoglycerate-independent phosphoglycerate mutase